MQGSVTEGSLVQYILHMYSKTDDTVYMFFRNIYKSKKKTETLAACMEMHTFRPNIKLTIYIIDIHNKYHKKVVKQHTLTKL